MRHWTNKYIGLPYHRYNCARLCQKVLKKEFNIDFVLPQLPRRYQEMNELIIKMEPNYEQIALPFEGCIVLMSGQDQMNHIGIYTLINKQHFVLHAMKIAGQTVLHRLDRLLSIGLKIEGFYAWPESRLQ